ncbi:MAG: Gx transporter family protein [Clostridiales bacterium]|nr:Gx transporter family protein [Clostridiales bacterium]
MENRPTARTIALYGMLIALAFVFSYIEAMIPIPLPVPGVKLGLANLVNVVGLYTVGIAGTIAVGLVRIVLVGFTFGNTFSMLYGLAGGILSLAVMVAVKKTGFFGSTGVSVLGGIFHNVGQLIVAAYVTKTAGVFTYLPVLTVAGVVAGTLIGLLGGLIVERIGNFVRRLDNSHM